MSSLKAIRKRIGSVKSTQKITRAMKMVAGARLARSQQRITALRPYAEKTAEVLQSVAQAMLQNAAEHEHDEQKHIHKLLERREEKKILVLVISADRGLAGGFNANISKATFRHWKEKEAAGAEVEFVTVGRKAREYLQRRNGTIAHDFPRLLDNVEMDQARTVASWVTTKFRKREVDSIYLVFSEFKSAIAQTPVVQQLLPLPEPPKDKDGNPLPVVKKNKDGEEVKVDPNAPTEFLFEPGPDALIERLLPMYLEIAIFRGLLESRASFFGAQMTAMDAATRNAKDLIGRLTLVYNRARQAAITTELMEIIGGAEALKE